MIEREGAFSASLVTSLTTAAGTTDGYVLPIEGVGTLYLGHITVKPGQRDFGMVRFVSTSGATALTFSGGGTNGESMP